MSDTERQQFLMPVDAPLDKRPGRFLGYTIANDMKRCWNGQPPDDRAWFDPAALPEDQACPGPAVCFAGIASAEAVRNRLLLNVPGACVMQLWATV